MLFHDSSKKMIASKHQNKAEFNNVDDSEVLSSDFSGLKTSAASLTSLASATSVASPTSTFIKELLIHDASMAPERPILVHICGRDHQKFNFLLISAPFLSEAVEASQCYLLKTGS
jgi:hypothetical protein